MLAAQAQTQQDVGPVNTLASIVVTGSYVHRTDVEIPSPITVMTAEQIQLSGVTTVTDAVRAIASDNSGTIPTAFTGGFARGSAGVALRGLTVNSTLVLVNGRRVAAYGYPDDGERSFVDLNTLPIGAVERIEVLRDGASSLYGADAIGGVVNLLLNPTYVGRELSVEGGTAAHGGGTTRRVAAKFGTGDLATDRSNAFLSLEWQRDDRITVPSRGFPFNSNDLTSIGGLNQQYGIPGSNTGTNYAAVRPATVSLPGALTSGVAIPGSLLQLLRPCGQDAIAHTNANGSFCTEDQAQYLDDQPAQERVGIYTKFTLRLADETRAYLEATYTQNETVAGVLPPQINSATPHNTNALVLPITIPGASGAPVLNPNNPFAALGEYALINYQFGDLPSGVSVKNHIARVVAGLQGTRWGWDYDTALVVNHTWLDALYQGVISYSGLMEAVTNGTYDFVNPSRNSAAVRASVSPGLELPATSDLNSLDLRATRRLGQLAGGPLGIAFGLEGRYEAQYFPQAFSGTDIQNNGPTQAIGSRHVLAAFVELDAPLVQSFDATVSARYDHYSDFGANFAPKIGVKWTPSRQVALRGTYSIGFRAPSFAEIGSSVMTGFAPETAPAAWAASHGNDAYTLPYNIAIRNSANSDIRPEKSRGMTLGVVYEPTKRLYVTLDYYVIRKTDVIVMTPPGGALSAAFAGQAPPAGTAVVYDRPDPLYPDAVPRPVGVSAQYQNASSLQTDGVDVEISAHAGLPDGVELVSTASVTKILSWNETLPGTPPTTLQFAGTQGPYILSSGAGTPRYRASWANTATLGQASLSATIYYTSGLYMSAPDFTFDNSCFSAGSTSAYMPPDCRMASFVDVDLTGAYRLSQHVTASFAILNVFDRRPPLDPINYAGTNYNPTYAQAGIVGRLWRVGVGYKF
jgi:iron complex outermembrane receptor protein